MPVVTPAGASGKDRQIMTATSKYDWTQFTLRIHINVPPARVFEAWTDDAVVSEWFTERTVIEPEKGGRVYFEWLGGDKLETRVRAISKNKRFVFPFGSRGEEVTVRLKKAKSGTVCELHQYNIKTSPRQKVEMHMGCKEGWVFFLTNLKCYLEHGIDLRNRDHRRSYRQHYVNS